MEEEEESTGNTCIHHWIIESPAYKRRNYRAEYTSLGSWSRGVCKKCKEERKFDNSLVVNKGFNMTIETDKVKQEKNKEQSLQNDEN